MQQKGGIALILLVLIVVAGLAVGVYFISSKTGLFSFAGSSQITIPYASPPAVPQESGTPSTEYQNPFEAEAEYQNPFEENYQNPFNSL